MLRRRCWNLERGPAAIVPRVGAIFRASWTPWVGVDLSSQFGQSRSKEMSLTDAGNSWEEMVWGVKGMKSFWKPKVLWGTAVRNAQSVIKNRGLVLRRKADSWGVPGKQADAEARAAWEMRWEGELEWEQGSRGRDPHVSKGEIFVEPEAAEAAHMPTSLPRVAAAAEIPKP